jgi:hypothetical protein
MGRSRTVGTAFCGRADPDVDQMRHYRMPKFDRVDE